MKLLKHQFRGCTWRPQERITTVGYFGGWGTGKTQGAAFDAITSAVRNPWQSPYGKGNPLGIIGAPTYSIMKNATLPRFEAALNAWFPGAIKKRRGAPDNYIILANGFKFLLVSGKSEMEGLDASVVWLDEISHPHYNKQKYLNYFARLRDPHSRHMRMIVSGLPVFGWVQDTFSRDTPVNKCILASTSDNPFIPRETIQNFLDACPSGHEEMLLSGKWMPPQDVVYPQYDGAVHLTNEQFATFDEIHLGIDVGNCGAILAAARKSYGMLCGDQIITRDISVEQMLLLAKQKPWWRNVTTVCIDPTVRRDELMAVQKHLPRAKIVKRPKGHMYYPVENGIRVVQRGLRDAHGNVHIKIHKSLVDHPDGLISFLTAYRRKEVSQEPMKDNRTDHVGDCLRYLACELIPTDVVKPSVIGRY